HPAPIDWMAPPGYDEVWVGEHHSAGWETIASPEIFIAAAAGRTRHIMLGSGVTSLPYHHPLMVANRFVQLDHMTRGRSMLGWGPGGPTPAILLRFGGHAPAVPPSAHGVQPLRAARSHDARPVDAGLRPRRAR